jgi:hypothetical protein
LGSVSCTRSPGSNAPGTASPAVGSGAGSVGWSGVVTGAQGTDEFPPARRALFETVGGPT